MGAFFMDGSFSSRTEKQLATAVQRLIQSDSDFNPEDPYSGSWGQKSSVKVANRTFPNWGMASEFVMNNSDKWDDLIIAVKVKTEADDAGWQWYIGTWCAE